MLNRAELFRKYVSVVVAALAWVLLSYSSVTAELLSFEDRLVHGGTITYDGAGGNLTGTGIVFDTITGDGTPVNDGVELEISGGVLNFSTGSNISYEANGGSLFWEFGSGGEFVLTGTVVDSNKNPVADGELLSGSWTAGPNPMVFGSSPYLILTGFGVETKNQDLLEYYGIESTSFQFSTTEISGDISSFNASTGAFTANVTEADIVNTASVPDASIMWLLGSSLLCLGMFGKRNSKKR